MVQTLGKWGCYLQEAKRCGSLGIWREAYNGARFMGVGGLYVTINIGWYKKLRINRPCMAR